MTGEFHTPRLLLRRFKASDRKPFASLNADPEAMKYFPGVLDDTASNALLARFESHFDEHGFGPWAVEVPGSDAFIGSVGLLRVSFESHFTPAVELTWRLQRASWRHGFATEAAREVCRIAFEDLCLPELVAFTVPANHRSRAVMARIGMTHNSVDDFDHPKLPDGHPLRRHVLHRLTSARWAKHVTVREECPSDVDAIARVETTAFPTTAEAMLVGKLRKNGAIALSLVAEVAGTVVGHVAFSPVVVNTPFGQVVGVGLAPMAVSPEYQRRGIGTQLVQCGLGQLRKSGHHFCVVLGHADYYPRHGFVRADAHGLWWEKPGHERSFFVCELAPGSLDGITGIVRYRPEFDAV
jgi:ribosomal-protein-alanine N-acetyltransferase